MQSLINIFNTTCKSEETYYGDHIDPNSLFGDSGTKKCVEFIENNFKRAGKGNALNVPFKEKYTTQGKHFHTVSLFLLGLTMESFFAELIKKSLTDLSPKCININKWYGEKEFQYSWFLTCLYHDVASCVENEAVFTKTCCSYCPKGLDFLGGFLSELDNMEYISRFKKETVTNYCHYRIDSGIKDHGILAGQMLYNKLTEAFKNVKSNLLYCDKDGFYNVGKLRWNREFIFLFAYVAEAIICHNMWMVSDSDRDKVEKYRLYGLDELIIQNDNQILSLDDYPLQFMLCLLDSIEPVKRFVSEKEPDSSKVRTVLENVSIQRNNNEIKISWSEKLKTMNGFWDWMKNICNLSNWMDVTVAPCQCDHLNQECSMIIIIHRR